jgi:hypothetical protein
MISRLKFKNKQISNDFLIVIFDLGALLESGFGIDKLFICSLNHAFNVPTSKGFKIRNQRIVNQHFCFFLPSNRVQDECFHGLGFRMSGLCFQNILSFLHSLLVHLLVEQLD